MGNNASGGGNQLGGTDVLKNLSNVGSPIKARAKKAGAEVDNVGPAGMNSTTPNLGPIATPPLPGVQPQMPNAGIGQPAGVVPTAGQIPPQPMASTGLGQGQPVAGQYGGQVINDADGRGFTNVGGGHDWNVGQGPGGNFGGQVNKTGQSIIGTELKSGDDLGYARGTQQWRDAGNARQGWIQSNLSQGRTLADLGMDPTRGGGLANYMRLGSTLHPGLASTGLGGPSPTPAPGGPGGNMPRGPISPGGPVGIGGPVTNPMISPTAVSPSTKGQAPTGLGEQMATNTGGVKQPDPRRRNMNSTGLTRTPMGTSRIG